MKETDYMIVGQTDVVAMGEDCVRYIADVFVEKYGEDVRERVTKRAANMVFILNQNADIMMLAIDCECQRNIAIKQAKEN